MTIHQLNKHPTQYAEGFEAQRIATFNKIRDLILTAVVTGAIVLASCSYHWNDYVLRKDCMTTDAEISRNLMDRE